MHYSAKRGLAIACRLSVCLSVHLSVTMVDCDHIGWKSWKLIARTISSSLPKRHPPTPRGTWGNFEETRGGVGKSGVLEHKSGNISETRKDRGKVTIWRVYRNSPTLFRTVPSLTPYGLLFPKIGGSQPPPKTPIAIIPGKGEAVKKEQLGLIPYHTPPAIYSVSIILYWFIGIRRRV